VGVGVREASVAAYWRWFRISCCWLVGICLVSYLLLQFGVQSLRTLGIEERGSSRYFGLNLLEGFVNAVPNAGAFGICHLIGRKRLGWDKVGLVVALYFGVIVLSDRSFGWVFSPTDPLNSTYFFKWWMLAVFTGVWVLVGGVFHRMVLANLDQPLPTQSFEV
jgi:hypothetical protein